MFEENDEHTHDRVKKLPIFKKAWEIMLLAIKISESVSKEDIKNIDEAEGEMLEGYAQYIREKLYSIT